MDLNNKSILLVSPEPWCHIFVSKHHYATHLVDLGNRVYFLNPPNSQFTCEKTEYKNLYQINYTGFINGLRFLPPFLQHYFIQRKFFQLQELCETKFDIVWSFDNSTFFDFSPIPKSVYCISHIVDFNQDFEFKKATKTANLCLTTTNAILKKQKKYNPNSFNIGHGLNIGANNQLTFKLRGIKEINCGYAGNLDIKYFDWILLEKLLRMFPSIDFHFVGKWNSKTNFPQICEMANFHYYGIINANELPAFYGLMDALILIYQFEKYPKQLANPHKMMEYLASGEMILATWTEEYDKLINENLIKMAKSPLEYLSTFNEVINNIDYWNNEEKKRNRRKYAHKNTYKNQISTVEKLIYS